MVTISDAATEDTEAILALQKLAYQSEAKLYNDRLLPPLTQTVGSLREDFASGVILKATLGERVVGSVRAKLNGETCEIGRLVVHPSGAAAARYRIGAVAQYRSKVQNCLEVRVVYRQQK